LPLADLSTEPSAAPKSDPVVRNSNGEGQPDHKVNHSNKVTHGASLHYNIQIHLPATKDIEVLNAIFKSLKEHLID
jgi:hypothetical protein